MALAVVQAPQLVAAVYQGGRRLLSKAGNNPATQKFLTQILPDLQAQLRNLPGQVYLDVQSLRRYVGLKTAQILEELDVVVFRNLEDLSYTVFHSPRLEPALAGSTRPLPVRIFNGLEEQFRVFMKELDDAGKSPKGGKRQKDRIEKKLNEAYSLVTKLSKFFDDLSDYRIHNKLPQYDLNDGATGTVALIELDGKKFYGLNSTLSPENLSLSLKSRREWFSKINWVPPLKKQPRDLGSIRALSHAEAHAIIKAHEELGGLPKRVELYVDRPTCGFCKGQLPALMKEFGIEELIIYSGSKGKDGFYVSLPLRK